MEGVMKLSPAYRTLAEKMLFQQNKKDFNLPDSVLSIVSFAYREEEAQIASHLGFIPRTATAIAGKVKRPVHEVEPVLKSLADGSAAGSTGDLRAESIPLILEDT